MARKASAPARGASLASCSAAARGASSSSYMAVSAFSVGAVSRTSSVTASTAPTPETRKTRNRRDTRDLSLPARPEAGRKDQLPFRRSTQRHYSRNRVWVDRGRSVGVCELAQQLHQLTALAL